MVQYIRACVRTAKRSSDLEHPYAQAIALVPGSSSEVWHAINTAILERWAPSTLERIKRKAWAAPTAAVGEDQRRELRQFILTKLKELTRARQSRDHRVAAQSLRRHHGGALMSGAIDNESLERYYDRATLVTIVKCDGPGCIAVFEGTYAERRAARWITAWRRDPVLKGLEVQVDLCPKCRRGKGQWPKPQRPRDEPRFDLGEDG